MTTHRSLLSVRDLRTTFATRDGEVVAVDGISFDVARGEVFAIVGESGSGKTVTALSILRLLPPTATVAGTILFEGDDLLASNDAQLRAVRGKRIAMIFQDPLTALNPVHTIGRQIGEVLRTHERIGRRAARARAVELLDLVGIPDPARRVDAYPHVLSGGMRQRAMIAMAVACRPSLLIADEPTTALDVTVQAQVLDVLMAIKDEIDSAIVLITHDLGVVAGLADRGLVMYAGRAAETGTTEQLFGTPRHPYTLGLLRSVPRLTDADGELHAIPGAPASALDRPPGCAFHPRCALARARCSTDVPELRTVDGDEHRSACHFAEELRDLAGAHRP